MRLLLVEDSELMAAQLGRELRELPGLELLGPVRCGECALRLSQAQRPQALLIGLAPGGGLPLLQQLCEALRPAPVLVLCASHEAALHARCRTLGAAAVFTQPEGLGECLQWLRQRLGALS